MHCTILIQNRYKVWSPVTGTAVLNRPEFERAMAVDGKRIWRGTEAQAKDRVARLNKKSEASRGLTGPVFFVADKNGKVIR